MKWFFHPSIIAFLLLIIVCAIGVSIIQSGNMNIIDTFLVVSKKEEKEVERFETAPPSSTSNQKAPGLQTEYSRLAASALQTTPKTEAECKADYDKCIEKGSKVGFCFSNYKICTASMKDIPIVSTNPMNIPNQMNLETIQGKQMEQKPASPTPSLSQTPVMTLEEIYAKYNPLLQETKPHETKRVLSASLRDMIRDDVAIAIQKELSMST